jgi:hypothetical protein
MSAIKERIDSKSFFRYTDEMAELSSGQMGISTHGDSGNFIMGPTSFSSPPTSIRMGGIYKFNPLAMTGIPSTMITPIPVFKFDLPVKNIATITKIAMLAKGI